MLLFIQFVVCIGGGLVGGYLYKVIENLAVKKFVDHARVELKKDDSDFKTRSEAEGVIEHLQAAIDKYGFATREDLADILGVNCSFSDTKYGWYNIDSAKVIKIKNFKYDISLPDSIKI